MKQWKWLRLCLRHGDDIRFCLLVIINAYIRPVPILKNLRSKGFSTLNCMVKNLGSQILNCLLDPKCRKALQCLNKCSSVDQVCNYRCIASYKSPNLEAFSLCVLRKNNCLELDAMIPEKPYVPPMVKFQGRDLCHQVAENIFIGWWGVWIAVGEPWQGKTWLTTSFLVNTSSFTGERQKKDETVFQVMTVEGEMVWRRRRYRVEAKSWGRFTLACWTMVSFPTSFGPLWMHQMILVAVCFTIVGLLELLGNLILGQCL